MEKSLVFQSSQPLVEYSKGEILNLADDVAKEIEQADSYEQAWAFLSKIELLCEEIKDKIKDGVIANVDKGNGFATGVKMRVMERTQNSFKNDETWIRLNDMLKERESLLKSLKEPTTFLDEITGEVIKLNPPIKTTTTYIKNEIL